jgi:hypothetical protein
MAARADEFAIRPETPASMALLMLMTEFLLLNGFEGFSAVCVWVRGKTVFRGTASAPFWRPFDGVRRC